MPRPKKIIVDEAVETTEAVSTEMPIVEVSKKPFYANMPATIVRTHEDGHVDLTVSYDGRTETSKNRVSPDAIEYR